MLIARAWTRDLIKVWTRAWLLMDKTIPRAVTSIPCNQLWVSQCSVLFYLQLFRLSCQFNVNCSKLNVRISLYERNYDKVRDETLLFHSPWHSCIVSYIWKKLINYSCIAVAIAVMLIGSIWIRRRTFPYPVAKCYRINATHRM